MAVKIRLKKMGRLHRPFFRVCVMHDHAPRDGRAIEELGYYDPMVRDVDARAVLNGERVAYWVGVGAQPTEKARTLIKKYGPNGTHLEKQKAALEKLATRVRQVPAQIVPQKPVKTEAKTEAPAEAAPEAPAAE